MVTSMCEETNDEVKRVAAAVLHGYCDLGGPVVVLGDGDILFHGRQLLESVVALNMPIDALKVRTTLSPMEWDESELPDGVRRQGRYFLPINFPRTSRQSFEHDSRRESAEQMWYKAGLGTAMPRLSRAAQAKSRCDWS